MTTSQFGSPPITLVHGLCIGEWPVSCYDDILVALLIKAITVCSHIDWHLREGFGLVFAEGIQDVVSKNADPVNAAWKGLCPTYDALPIAEQ